MITLMHSGDVTILDALGASTIRLCNYIPVTLDILYYYSRKYLINKVAVITNRLT
jgi:hypothetical protein